MTFDPNEHLSKLSGKDYLEVKWRLVWFRDRYPHGEIETEHIEIGEDHAVFKATVRNGIQAGGYATGYGSESKRDFRDFIEKAETKAIGRALAALGFGTQFAPELEEGERIVDSPVERKAAFATMPKPLNDGEFAKLANEAGADPAIWKRLTDAAGQDTTRWERLFELAPSDAFRQRLDQLAPKAAR